MIKKRMYKIFAQMPFISGISKKLLIFSGFLMLCSIGYGQGFTVAESVGTTATSETGTTDSFTVVLDTQPLTSVVIDVTSGDLGEGTVDVASLTFTNGNWDTAQPVTVTGQDDVLVDGDQTYSGNVVFDSAGVAGNPIVVRGIRVDGQRPHIDGGVNTIEFRANHYLLEGFEITGGSRPL